VFETDYDVFQLFLLSFLPFLWMFGKRLPSKSEKYYTLFDLEKSEIHKGCEHIFKRKLQKCTDTLPEV